MEIAKSSLKNDDKFSTIANFVTYIKPHQLHEKIMIAHNDNIKQEIFNILPDKVKQHLPSITESTIPTILIKPL